MMGELKCNLEKVKYHHIVLDGSGYEAGKQESRWMFCCKEILDVLLAYSLSIGFIPFSDEGFADSCNHFYNEYFGTLWSMIFDVTQNSVDVCFSAPTHNKYRSFGLNDPTGITEYPTIVPIKLRAKA